MNDAALPETCWATVWVGLGWAAYLGPSLRLREHSGSVHCFALGVDAEFTVHAGGEMHVRSALIPARVPSHVTGGNGRMLFLYRDPNPAWLARVRTRMTRSGAIHIGHADEAAFAAAARDGHLPLLGTFNDTPDAAYAADARIDAVLRLMRADRDGRLTAAEAAEAVHLSASRFQHLFSAHTGTTFRRYRLWTRMRHVAAAVAEGHTLTAAAVDAGFASPGHFSDSFRALFGLSASRLLTAGTRLIVTDDRRVPGDQRDCSASTATACAMTSLRSTSGSGMAIR